MVKIIRNGREISPVLNNILRGIVPTTSGWGDAPITYATQFDSQLSAYTSYTTAANNSTANDVPLIANAIPFGATDSFYFGMNKTFNYIKINVGTAGTVGTVTWEYYNGTAWTTLTVTDNTSGFTVLGTNTVTFTIPTNWAQTTVNAETGYFVRARKTAGYTVLPIGTQIRLDGEPRNLSYATDGNRTTATDIGSRNATGATSYGYFIFDLGSTKNALITIRIGLWTSGGVQTNNVSIDTSDDNITYQTVNSNNMVIASSSEKIVDTLITGISKRYFRIKCYISGAEFAYVRLYEVCAYEVNI